MSMTPRPDSTTLQAWLGEAMATARAAGSKLLEHFEGELEIGTKSTDIDLVTAADRASERIIVERLRDAFPDHGILAEESGQVVSGDGPTWMVDPLDGTTNFAHGFPHFSVVMALYCDGEGWLGLVHDPLRDEMFTATIGGGAWIDSPRHQHAQLRVTSETDLGRTLLATGFGYDRATATRNNVEEFTSMLARVRGIRRPGSAALDLCYVAAGRIDGYWEYALNPWDWAAGALIVREAGGEAVTRAGTPWRPGDDSLAAANPELLPSLARTLWP